MAVVNERFADALQACLNGRFTDLVSARDSCCPAHARQAGVEAEVIGRSAAAALGLEFAESLAALPASHEFLQKVPIGFARRHGLLGLATDGNGMRLAMADLAEWPKVRTLEKALSIMQAGAGEKFDPDLVHLLVSMIERARSEHPDLFERIPQGQEERDVEAGGSTA